MSGPRRLSFTGPRFATADDLTRLRADLPGDPHGPGAFTLAIGRPAVGFAHAVAVAPGHWHLAHLHVERDARRRGLGRYLLDSALGTALDRGALRLTVSPPSKAPWRALYARAGFAPEEYGDGTLAVALADEPPPRPAVSVIPVRQGADGLEVFIQHRVRTMDAFAGVVVFPGGRVDPADEASGRALTLASAVLDAHARSWSATGHDPRTLLATGIRELAEETGAVVDPARLLPWDNWITPLGYARRFDVAFFLLPDDADTHVHSTTEATASEWLAVDELVARTEAGVLAMVPPTRTLVDELQRLGSLDAVLGLARGMGTVVPVRHDVASPRPRSMSPRR